MTRSRRPSPDTRGEVRHRPRRPSGPPRPIPTGPERRLPLPGRRALHPRRRNGGLEVAWSPDHQDPDGALTTLEPEAPTDPRSGVGSEAAGPDVALGEAVADRGRFGYRPALDGVRAVAVVGVLLYHGTLWWTAGGFLGVDVFFALSGYLITTLLVLEHDATGRIDLGGFWVRRARRLLPAL